MFVRDVQFLMFGGITHVGNLRGSEAGGTTVAVYACTNCGWVRRLDKEGTGERCESCGAVACCLTPSGDLGHRRARLAAASARALHRQSLGLARARSL